MFPIDPMWVYIGVPAILVSTLLLIKIRQKETSNHDEDVFVEEEKQNVQIPRKEHSTDTRTWVNENRAESESSKRTKPQDCSHYLGYLYMRKAPDRTHIPTECYNCRRLLQCLYSPNVIEKVYGE